VAQTKKVNKEVTTNGNGTHGRGMRRDGKVSIYAVAEAAGVSYGTVSRVLNNRPDVSEGTRRRVLEVAKELGYVPSPIARSLSKNSTAALGIVVPGIADPFFMPIAQSIEAEARKMGLATLLHDTGRTAGAALEGALALAQFRVSGIIILGGGAQRDSEIAEALEGIPTVVVLRRSLNHRFPAVYLDNAKGARMVVEHLLEIGRRRIAFVRGDLDSVAGIDRLRGYREALANAGFAAEPTLVEQGLFTIEGSAEATVRLLQLPADKRPDAIFYASDAMALSGMHQLHEAGVRVPDDIAVAGYGNIEFAPIAHPPLTTVRVSKRLLGTYATELLKRVMEDSGARADDIEVEVDLMRRASTG
jgi:DNA-binding LacI/PurR family transcriptional regulator